MEEIVTLIVSFVIIMGLINLYKTKNSKVKYVQANLYKNDHNQYLCRINEGIPKNPSDIHDSQAGANALSFIRANLIKLVKEVEKIYNGTYDKDKKIDLKSIKKDGIVKGEIKMLIERFNPDNISESTPSDKYTSYSVNKGEKIIFCIRRKKDGPKQQKFEIIDPNTLMFVAIHELAHVMTKSIGHGDDFWNNMRFLLQVAIKTDSVGDIIDKTSNEHYIKHKKIYTYEDYSSNPQDYCGTQITTTPCKNDECKK